MNSVPVASARADASDYDQLLQCMRCGSCLPVCPTYQTTRLERDSPRGRIRLIKAMADGELAMTPAFVETMSYCLDCRACETACPAGVRYGGLAEAARARIAAEARPSPAARLARRVLLDGLFASRDRLRAAAAVLRAAQWSGLQELARSSGLLRLAPRRVRELEALSPRAGSPWPADPLPSVARPVGPARRRVGLLAGCVMDFLYHEVHRDTIEVLTRNGCEVVIPPRQGCCGSLHGHTGDPAAARAFARRNIAAFAAAGVDAVIVNAAGCGSFMREYGRLFAGDRAWAGRARAFAGKVRDVAEFLVEINFQRPARDPGSDGGGEVAPGRGSAGFQPARRGGRPDGGATSGSEGLPVQGPRSVRVTYHEACHLVHGQRVSAAPRAILRAVPGVEVVELAEATWCCGSAGIYNLTRPDDAAGFLDRKMRNLAATGADVVAVGNPGCAAQLAAGIRARGLRMRVAHPVSLLAEAYRGERPINSKSKIKN